MRETYLRFLSLAQTLDAASVSTVDETARHLLQLIALRHAQGNALTVTEAMAMSTVASPATIHRKLDALREAGLIAQMFEGRIAVPNTWFPPQQQMPTLLNLAT